MNIQCPKCETIFDYAPIGKLNKFKCSICYHIWVESSNVEKDLSKSTKSFKSNYKKPFILNLVILLLIILSFFIFRDHLENIDSYWQNTYFFFDNLIPIK